MKPCAYGHDGIGYSRGDRVELHPGTDLWMQGARFGTVTFIRLGSTDVNVRVDKTGKVVTMDQTRFKRIE